MSALTRRSQGKLDPGVNRILFVRNLPFKITTEELFDVFGKYGAIRQMRVGTAADTKGTAFVVYEDIYDAKQACEHLSGFNLTGRYLVVLYFQPHRLARRMDLKKKEMELKEMRKRLREQKGSSGPSQQGGA